MRKPGEKAVLFLNDEPVGEVTVRNWDSSWGFGDFQAQPAFSRFAPLYGTWSLLMHADQDNEADLDRLSSEASEELSFAERRLDQVKVELQFTGEAQRIRVAQLNIDGTLLEWKEY